MGLDKMVKNSLTLNCIEDVEKAASLDFDWNNQVVQHPPKGMKIV
jgi:hypothetical protein